MAYNPNSPWNPKKNGIYARSITASQVNSVSPLLFANGGAYARVYNSGATDILFQAYRTGAGTPSLAFPVDAAPPVATSPGAVVIKAGETRVFGIPADADSFAAIGSAAGPGVIYVQRGDGV